MVREPYCLGVQCPDPSKLSEEEWVMWSVKALQAAAETDGCYLGEITFSEDGEWTCSMAYPK